MIFKAPFCSNLNCFSNFLRLFLEPSWVQIEPEWEDSELKWSSLSLIQQDRQKDDSRIKHPELGTGRRPLSSSQARPSMNPNIQLSQGEGWEI